MLHIFVLLMMAAFIMLNFLAATGAFDTWNSRYLKKSKRPKLLDPADINGPVPGTITG